MKFFLCCPKFTKSVSDMESTEGAQRKLRSLSLSFLSNASAIKSLLFTKGRKIMTSVRVPDICFKVL